MSLGAGHNQAGRFPLASMTCVSAVVAYRLAFHVVGFWSHVGQVLGFLEVCSSCVMSFGGV